MINNFKCYFHGSTSIFVSQLIKMNKQLTYESGMLHMVWYNLKMYLMFTEMVKVLNCVVLYCIQIHRVLLKFSSV